MFLEKILANMNDMNTAIEPATNATAKKSHNCCSLKRGSNLPTKTAIPVLGLLTE